MRERHDIGIVIAFVVFCLVVVYAVAQHDTTTTNTIIMTLPEARENPACTVADITDSFLIMDCPDGYIMTPAATATVQGDTF